MNNSDASWYPHRTNRKTRDFFYPNSRKKELAQQKDKNIHFVKYDRKDYAWIFEYLNRPLIWQKANLITCL